MHEEWVLFVVMDIPATVAGNNNAPAVATRLRTAGYAVTTETVEGVDVLTATPPEGPDYRDVIWGLGRFERGSIRVDIQCNVGYLRGGCPSDSEFLLRDQLDMLATDSALPLYTRGADFGDDDFAVLDEVILFAGQLFFGAVSVAGLTVLAASLLDQHKVETTAIQPRNKVSRVPPKGS
jgi:hypothetical protein